MTPPCPASDSELPMILAQDHMLIELDGEVALIDTGAPGSMRAPELVTDELGTRVDWILGVDWLGERRITLDWPGRRVTFGDIADEGEIFALRPSLGLYQIELIAGGISGWAFLDTGAQLSYASPAACQGLQPAGRRRDFYPGFGAFDLDVYDLSARVGSREITGAFGVLPPLLLGLLTIVGHDGWILGSDFFRDRRIVLDLERDQVLDVTGGRVRSAGHA